jgi:Membrane bound O-acyl transferase family
VLVLGAPRLRDGSWIHGGGAAPARVGSAAAGGADRATLWHGWPAPLRLAVTTLVLYAALKATAILRQSPGELLRASPAGRLVYLTVWPGMSLAPFRARASSHPDGRRWLRRGLVRMALGGFAVLALSRWTPRESDGLLGWAGIGALLLTVHLGYADVLSGLLRCAGFPVRRLFDDPLASRSLTEFWSRRWNLAFVEMDRLLFVPLLRRVGPMGSLIGVFVISGLLHELAISFPAGAGWGLPSCYFLLQGVLVTLERHLLRPRRWPGALARIWTWSWLLVPLPLLFHTPFRQALVVPLFHRLHQVLW